MPNQRHISYGSAQRLLRLFGEARECAREERLRHLLDGFRALVGAAGVAAGIADDFPGTGAARLRGDLLTSGYDGTFAKVIRDYMERGLVPDPAIRTMQLAARPDR